MQNENITDSVSNTGDEKNASIELLKEIDSGCFMAINSFQQLEEYEMPQGLFQVVSKYKAKHDELQKEASRLLHEYDETDKQPGMMASAMSKMTTDLKMMMHEDATQITKIIMNGCNMGIQQIGEKMNKYEAASDEAKNLAKKLIKVEEDLLSDVKEYL